MVALLTYKVLWNGQREESNKPKMKENRDNQQYFFTDECTQRLSELVDNKTVCLCVPSVAIKSNALCLDIDKRLSGNFMRYDLHRGLHSKHRQNTRELTPVLEYQFLTVLFDPPFSLVTPNEIARNVNALLQWDEQATAYVCYPNTGFQALENAFLNYGFLGEDSNIDLEYNFPPRNMGLGERREIKLYRFCRGL